MKILVVYGSKYGSTREVAEAIASELGADARPAGEVAGISDYDAVVVGAGIYIGRLHKAARTFLERHRDELEERPFAVFAMGPGRDREQDWDGARTSLDRALAKLRVHPAAKAVFGGVVDPATLRFPLNRMPAADLRDWETIRTWARSLPEALAGDATTIRRAAAPWPSG